MENVEIRELEEKDLFNGFLTSLDSLKKASNLEPEKVRNIYQKIKSTGNQIIFVAIEDSKVVGSATLFIEQKFIHNGSKVGHIEDVVVTKNKQGKGMGKKLIQKMLEYSSTKGCYKTVLSCLDDLKPFYENIGFKPHLKGMRFDHNLNSL